MPRDKLKTTNYTVVFPDTWDTDDQGIFANKEGFYATFSSAKKSMIEAIDTQIWSLKQYRKAIMSMKEDD